MTRTQPCTLSCFLSSIQIVQGCCGIPWELYNLSSTAYGTATSCNTIIYIDHDIGESSLLQKKDWLAQKSLQQRIIMQWAYARKPWSRRTFLVSHECQCSMLSNTYVTRLLCCVKLHLKTTFNCLKHFVFMCPAFYRFKLFLNKKRTKQPLVCPGLCIRGGRLSRECPRLLPLPSLVTLQTKFEPWTWPSRWCMCGFNMSSNYC